MGSQQNNKIKPSNGVAMYKMNHQILLTKSRQNHCQFTVSGKRMNFHSLFSDSSQDCQKTMK